MSETPLLLDIGCGPTPRPGFTGIDRKHGGEAHPLMFNDGTSVPDESASLAVASHVLEHFPRAQTELVLREWVRVLKPGGWLKIAVPDFAWIVEEYAASQGDSPYPLIGFLMGGQTDANDFHFATFDVEDLECLLAACGLRDIQPWVSTERDCAALPVSLNRMGRKAYPWETGDDADTDGGTASDGATIDPETGQARIGSTAQRQVVAAPIDANGLSLPADFNPLRSPLRKRVRCVMSAPRLGFLDQQVCAQRAMGALGIESTIGGGAYWEQVLTDQIERYMDSGADYILTLDYDTIFTAADVLELITLMDEHPEVDALAPMQSKRGGHWTLFTVRDENDNARMQMSFEELETDVVRVTTAHFGLTVLRVEALRRCKRPWFWHQPDADGRWGEGRIDADSYFWLKSWRDAGNTLYLAPRVVVGHLQLMITWPGVGNRPVNQHVSDWHDSGKPKRGVWR